MQLTLSDQLKQFLRVMQGCLFPTLEERLGPLTDKLQQLVSVLNLIQIESMVASWPGGVGRPAPHRRAIARAFVAKAVYNMSTTRELLDRLANDVCLRRICGWESRREIPHESQFSRAFAEFAATELPLARRAHRGDPERTAGRPHLAGFHRDRSPRKAGAHPGCGRAGQAHTQAGQAAEKRAT